MITRKVSTLFFLTIVLFSLSNAQNIIVNGHFENEEDSLFGWEIRTIEETSATTSVVKGELKISNVSGIRFIGDVALFQFFSGDQKTNLEEDAFYTISFDGRASKTNREVQFYFFEKVNLANRFIADTTVYFDTLMTSYSHMFEYKPLDISSEMGIILAISGGNSEFVFDNISLKKVVNTYSEGEEKSLQFELFQNYPNPFNPSTKIEFSLAKSTIVSIKVFDLSGKEVATIIDNKRYSSGRVAVPFDASALSSGVYIYKLYVPGFIHTRKMTLIK